MPAFKDAVDRILNWSGGSYVGLATLTVIGLAIAQFFSGEPVVVKVNNVEVIYMVHRAPEWFVSAVGVFTIILGLFWAGKPINTYISQKGNPPPTPAPAPEERPLEK